MKKMNEETKKSIDSMDYEGMLSLWRFAKVGHPMFQGEIGKYFNKVMNEKRDALSDDERVQASKNIGWN